MIWWLSVDNYNVMFGRLNRLRRWGWKSFLKHIVLNDYCSEKDLDQIPLHMVQSYFAKDFIMKKGITENRIVYLSDYVNDIYTNGECVGKKEEVVIYNPKKGYEFTQKIVDAAQDIHWIPIENMTNQQVFELMHRAKVYIDFGNHPGKDRIPREAAVSGCCVITNKNGSAAFQQDVHIPEKYKFDGSRSIEEIVQTIRYCLSYYDNAIDDFQEYRDYIIGEKEQFIRDIIEIFSGQNV